MALSQAKQERNAHRARARVAQPFKMLLDAHRDHAVHRFVVEGEVDRRYLPADLVAWADAHPRYVSTPAGGA